MQGSLSIERMPQQASLGKPLVRGRVAELNRSSRLSQN